PHLCAACLVAPKLRVLVVRLARVVGSAEVGRDDPVLRGCGPFTLLARLGAARRRAAALLARLLGALPAVVAGHALPPRSWGLRWQYPVGGGRSRAGSGRPRAGARRATGRGARDARELTRRRGVG